jgi:hypothetical protein
MKIISKTFIIETSVVSNESNIKIKNGVKIFTQNKRNELIDK